MSIFDVRAPKEAGDDETGIHNFLDAIDYFFVNPNE